MDKIDALLEGHTRIRHRLEDKVTKLEKELKYWRVRYLVAEMVLVSKTMLNVIPISDRSRSKYIGWYNKYLSLMEMLGSPEIMNKYVHKD